MANLFQGFFGKRQAEQPSIGADTDLAGQQISVMDLVGVTPVSLARYLDQCGQQLERLRQAEDLIMDRHIRLDLKQVADNLAAIIENCRQDPNDIREEIALGDFMRRLNDTLHDDLLRVLVEGRQEDPTLAGETDLIKVNIKEVIRWTGELLTRMKGNDQLSHIHRTQVLSEVFRRKDN